MTVPRTSALALSAAETLEKSAGPRAGLAAFKTLALNLGHDESRARAILGAIRCAVAAGDDQAIGGVSAWWRSIGGEGSYEGEILDLTRSLLARGRAAAAAFLAEAEVERAPRARSLYLLARCLEIVGDDVRAVSSWGQAAERAEKEGLADVARAARVKRSARLAERTETLALALAEIAAVDAGACTPAEKVALCTIRLRAPSRFTRASALATLDDVARGDDPWLAERAILVAARHADVMGGALTALEADRLAVVLAAWPDEAERDAAILRVRALVRIEPERSQRDEAWIEAAERGAETAPHARRVRAMLAGAGAGPYAPPDEASDVVRIGAFALDAIVALRAGDDAGAARALGSTAAIVRAAGDAPPSPAPAWTALHVALEGGKAGRGANDAAQVRAAAIDLAGALLASPGAGPPRGFVAVAAAIGASGVATASDLELRALREADARAEPGSKDALVRALARSGWAADAKGDRAAAIAALREAAELARRAV